MENEKNRRRTGTKYEKIAGEFLEKQGYRILEYNFRCRYAEIDIVAKDGEYLVFCEVKFRKTGGLSAALEAVSVPKQMRLSGAAVYYLMKNGCTEIPCRFDVIGIAGNKISLRKNAFEYCGDFGIVWFMIPGKGRWLPADITIRESTDENRIKI